MRAKKTQRHLLLVMSVVVGVILGASVHVPAAGPSGVLKQAIHWGLSADWLDPATIGARLGYLFGPTSYGNYPDMKALWDQYQTEINPKVRKDLMGRIQNLIHERTMFIPLTDTNSPAALGPRVKGNPYKIQPLIWFTAPFEDMELTN